MKRKNKIDQYMHDIKESTMKFWQNISAILSE